MKENHTAHPKLIQMKGNANKKQVSNQQQQLAEQDSEIKQLEQLVEQLQKSKENQQISDAQNLEISRNVENNQQVLELEYSFNQQTYQQKENERNTQQITQSFSPNEEKNLNDYFQSSQDLQNQPQINNIQAQITQVKQADQYYLNQQMQLQSPIYEDQQKTTQLESQQEVQNAQNQFQEIKQNDIKSMQTKQIIVHEQLITENQVQSNQEQIESQYTVQQESIKKKQEEQLEIETQFPVLNFLLESSSDIILPNLTFYPSVKTLPMFLQQYRQQIVFQQQLAISDKLCQIYVFQFLSSVCFLIKCIENENEFVVNFPISYIQGQVQVNVLNILKCLEFKENENLFALILNSNNFQKINEQQTQIKELYTYKLQTLDHQVDIKILKVISKVKSQVKVLGQIQTQTCEILLTDQQVKDYKLEDDETNPQEVQQNCFSLVQCLEVIQKGEFFELKLK